MPAPLFSALLISGWPIAAATALGLSFWIWMIVDCIRNEKDSTSKIAWLFVILLGSLVGAPTYFFVRWLPRRRPVTSS